MLCSILLISTILALSPVVFADTYRLTDNYVGKGFLTGFSHQAISDPSHGRGFAVMFNSYG